MPRCVILESSVTFLPQFFGAAARRRSPTLDHPYSGESEMFAPISSTNTRREASSLSEQPLDDSVRLRRPPAALARGERLLVGREPAVALDRGRADAESAGGFGLGHAALDGGDNPGA